MTSLALLAALAALAPAVLVDGQEPGPPLASGLVRSLEIQPVAGTVVQHLRLDRDGAAESEPPLALLRYVAGPDPAGGVRADLELSFLADGVKVIHTEHASARTRRIVFREVRERAGRTLFLEGEPELGYLGYELGGREPVRRELVGAGELPLLLIESARLGMGVPEEAAVLDPLSAALESLSLSSREAGGERVFEARRADGSLRWRVRSRDGALAEWRFREGGPAARAVEPAEFERLRAQHELAESAAREAAALAEAAKHPALRGR